MVVSKLESVVVTILLLSSFTCLAQEPASSRKNEPQPRLVFDRLVGGQYFFFFLENDTPKRIYLLVDNHFALDTAAECRSKHTVSRSSTFFPLRDPVAPNQMSPDTKVAPGARLELKVSSPILSASADLLAKFKGGLCRVRIQLHQPDEVVESNEFEP